MKIARSPAEVARDNDSVVTVGTFDGVHVAHRAILQTVVQRAHATGGRSIVVTFDPHPKQVVASAKGPVQLLTTVEERIEAIKALEVDFLLILEFTYAFSRMTSRGFYETYIVKGTGVREVVVGYDHMFGRDREAGITDLKNYGKEFGFDVVTVPPVTMDGGAVSSTRIRRALVDGDVSTAARFLGKPYALSGIVIHGDGLGRRLGFPTANIAPATSLKVIPGQGVYAVRTLLGRQRLFGMLNIGTRPTVSNDGKQSIEVHLFDVDEDFYGGEIVIQFLRRLRDEKKFDSIDELVAQMHKDKEEALSVATSYGSPA
jgi:riboflavin kinase/FMN adenylyltransferase